MEKARPTTGNAYLTRQGASPGREMSGSRPCIETGGGRTAPVIWLSPLYDDSGDWLTSSSLMQDGLKRTLKGGQVKGRAHFSTGKRGGKTAVDSGGRATALHRASPDRRNRHGGAVVGEPPFLWRALPVPEISGLSDCHCRRP